jgi:hypothetical protein
MSLLVEKPSLPSHKSPFIDVFKDVIERYGKRNDGDLKRIVYLTSPMRKILRREKYQRDNMFNAPIDFSAEKTI